MDYSVHECESCAKKVHPANVVHYHIGKREFNFCSQECKREWMDDNMPCEGHPAVQPQLHFMGDGHG